MLIIGEISLNTNPLVAEGEPIYNPLVAEGEPIYNPLVTEGELIYNPHLVTLVLTHAV
jgi:hypothetical protein